MTRLFALLGLTLALIAGCANPATDTPAGPPPAAQVATPAAVEIPAIGARSTLIPTGLNPDGTIEVPPVEQPQQASWYEQSPRPGQTGPAVILGHVNGGGRDGVFVNLDDLAAGDQVLVDRTDGTTTQFEVYRVDTVDKDTFPTAQVYGDTAGPELRLITCGGPFIGGDQGYADNIIAYARETT